MKKLLIVVISLAMWLSACAPASAPETEIIPTTSAPVVTEAPVSLPEVTRVKFVYEYNYVPVSWVQNYMEEEIVSFYSRGTEWSTKSLTPVFTYHGPLFPIDIDYLINKVGDCGIDTYRNTLDNKDQSMSVNLFAGYLDLKKLPLQLFVFQTVIWILVKNSLAHSMANLVFCSTP